MRRAFVSHSTSDDSYVAEMESFLRATGFDDVSAIRPNEKFWPEVDSWKSPAANLVAGKKLINDCGYHRRDEELADAKVANPVEVTSHACPHRIH